MKNKEEVRFSPYDNEVSKVNISLVFVYNIYKLFDLLTYMAGDSIIRLYLYNFGGVLPLAKNKQ
jgi:hypothetical protein